MAGPHLKNPSIPRHFGRRECFPPPLRNYSLHGIAGDGRDYADWVFRVPAFAAPPHAAAITHSTKR